METKILGFSGKLQSGKDSACNMLIGIAMVNVLKLTRWAEVNDKGQLMIEHEAESPDHTGQVPIYRDVFNVDSRDQELRSWMSQAIWPHIRKFSLAEPLKEFCQHVLGLSEGQVWGSNDEKNSLTHLRWEDVPTEVFDGVTKGGSKKFKKGQMTGREVLEYFGSQICRKMYPNVWADALIHGIKMLSPEHALISDVRFVNEAEAIQSAGGKVIRLTRTTEDAAKNTHVSNLDLDSYENFDYVLDNNNLSMKETHEKLIEKLVEWEFLKLESIDQ